MFDYPTNLTGSIEKQKITLVIWSYDLQLV